MSLRKRTGTTGAFVDRAPGGVARPVAEAMERRVLLASTSPAGPVLFYEGFEAGNFAGWSRDVDGSGSVRTVNAAAAPVRAGTGAGAFSLPAGSKRSELYLPPDPAGSERWYASSVFVPADYPADSYRDIVMQWHEIPDWDLGETWRVPPLSLAVVDDTWQVASRWDSRPVNNGDTWNPPAPFGGRKEYYAPVAHGVWTDWVFHVKWSYQSGGLLEVWKDGAKVVDQAGPNTYNDQTGNYLKVGVYHPDVALDTAPVTPLKVLYQDEVRVGDATATYADVAPGATVTAPATVVRAAADGYARDGTYAGQSFGQAASLEVKRATAAGSTRESYLRFNLGQFGSAADIGTATLRLYGMSSGDAAPGVGVGLYPVAGLSWPEAGMTWKTKPAAGTAPLGTQAVRGTAGAWYEFDVTSYLAQQKAAGASAVAFALKGMAATDGSASFNSDEAKANPPQLVVRKRAAPPQQLVVSDAPLAVPEGGSASFAVALGTAPAADVTVAIARQPGGDADLTVGASTLTFTPANWSVPQTVTVAAAPDPDGENGTAVFTLSALGAASKAVAAAEVDDDPPVTQTVSLRAAADGHARDGSFAAQSFGQAWVLEVKKATSPPGYNRESSLRFDLTGVGAAADLVSATLRLHGKMLNTASASVAVNVYGSANVTWAEAKLTWNNRPAAGGVPLGTAVVAGTVGKWYEVDVGAYLKQQRAAGATAVTFVLRGAAVNDGLAGFDSDESGAGGPQLTVVRRSR